MVNRAKNKIFNSKSKKRFTKNQNFERTAKEIATIRSVRTKLF